MARTITEDVAEKVKDVFLKKGLSATAFEKMYVYYKKYTNIPFATINLANVERRLECIISSLSNLGMTKEDIDICFSKNSAFYFQNQDRVRQRIFENAKVFDLSVEKFIELGIKMPQLFTLRADRLTQNIHEISEMLKTTPNKFIKIALKQPSLFCYTADTIKEKADIIGKKFSISPNDYYAMGLQAPTVLCMSTDLIVKNVKALAKILNTSVEMTLKYPVKRQPALLYLSSEFIVQNLKTTAKSLNVSVSDLAKLGMKVPNVLYQKGNTLVHNVKQLSELLDVPSEILIKTGLKCGAILCLKPETLNANIEGMSKLLNVPKNCMTKAVLTSPTLIYQKPETINHNIEEVCRLTGIDKDRYVQSALKHPALFYTNPHHQYQKINFYRQMHRKGLLSVSGNNSSEQFIQRLLNAPAKMMYAIDNLHLRCAYARLICETTGNAGSQALDKTKEQVISALKTAPEDFKKRNPVAMRLIEKERVKG